MKIIVSDLDGTLLHNKTISEKNLSAIKKWMEQGNVFTLATGRPLSETKQYINSIQCIFPVITYNGNVIFDPISNKMEVVKPLSQSYVNTLLKSLYSNKLLHNVVLYGIHNNYVINPTNLLLEKLNSWVTQYTIVTELWGFLTEGETLISMLIYTSSELIQKILDLNIEHKEVEILNSSSKILDIIPKGISKGAALKKLLSKSNFDKVFVVGDGLNDLSLAFDNNIVVAVNNAVNEYKELSHIIIPSCDNDAIFDLICQIN